MDRARDILDAVARIRRHVGNDRTAFDSDELIQVWVLHHLQLIGEAANGLSEAARAAESGIPWRSVIGMRHVLVHGYFDIDLDLVWTVVESHLEAVRAAAAQLAESID
ncbi:MAG: HepT-like ribonuclease domain-containing protein [Sporichthyaceae bacterium]